MTEEIIRKYIDLGAYADYPKCGLFYAAQGRIITRDFCQWAVDPAAGSVFPEFDGFRLEHRDMWDALIRKDYVSVAEEYADDHKALPRGRVELLNDGRKDLRFHVTLCPCLNVPDFKDQVLRAFKLRGYQVSWSFGTMNYVCRDCRQAADFAE